MLKEGKRVLSQKRYDEGLKRKIAQQYLDGEASYQVLANEYDLKNKDVVKEFVRWYRRILANESLSFEMKNKDDNNENVEENRSKEELLELLKHERLRNEMLEALIIEANKLYETNIKKNFGSKR
jgi:transposase-like protein